MQPTRSVKIASIWLRHDSSRFGSVISPHALTSVNRIADPELTNISRSSLRTDWGWRY